MRILVASADEALGRPVLDTLLATGLVCERVDGLDAAQVRLRTAPCSALVWIDKAATDLGELAEVLPVVPTVVISPEVRGAVPQHFRVLASANKLTATVRTLLASVADESATLVARDPRSLALTRLTEKVADTQATVLLSGESGVGKEVFARHIHAHSPCRGGPFVAINCAAIPESMLEAHLFGHEKGAFTGATAARAGKFEAANHGTLLLDEISEMDLSLQAKLLRVLQEREVERLGGHRTIALDVRVIATTNRDLVAEVEAGRFRQDLYYRLSVFPVAIAPLRARKADIRPLAQHLLARQTLQGTRYHLSECAIAALEAHPWPGNVRELANVVQRSMILSDGVIDETVVSQCLSAAPRPRLSASAGAPLESQLRQAESALIIEALGAENGNRQRAAEMLGISARTLRYKMARLREAGVALPV